MGDGVFPLCCDLQVFWAIGKRAAHRQVSFLRWGEGGGGRMWGLLIWGCSETLHFSTIRKGRSMVAASVKPGQSPWWFRSCPLATASPNSVALATSSTSPVPSPPRLWHLSFILKKKYLDLPVIPSCYFERDNALYTWSSLGLKYLKCTNYFSAMGFRKIIWDLKSQKWPPVSPGLVVSVLWAKRDGIVSDVWVKQRTIMGTADSFSGAGLQMSPFDVLLPLPLFICLASTWLAPPSEFCPPARDLSKSKWVGAIFSLNLHSLPAG